MHCRTILVVDDCDLTQMVIAMEIARFNPSVTIIEAFDGQEAMEKLREMSSPPEAIFLDINMPRMNGHDFLEAYQAGSMEQGNVAMMSSSSLDEDRQRAEQYACVKHYFTKPFNAQHLEQTVPHLAVVV
ncbi:MAG: response regulator [Erythrobacter sp.]